MPTVEDITLPREEWEAVGRELSATSQGIAPSDLRFRIADLLADIPAAWANELCTLSLDPSIAETVRSIVRRGRGQTDEPDERRARTMGLSEAEDVIREHQGQAGGARYRIEHRTEEGTVVLGYTMATHARQAELSAHASLLMSRGAQGELVLVDLETGQDVARRRLISAPGDDFDLADEVDTG
jgi:hypothetical protein